MINEHGFVAALGDLHNHCNISYGHGSLEDALTNAALRLDFVSITGHASWPDMPSDDPRVAHIVAFHVEGFEKLRTGWDHYLHRIAAFERDNGLVTFPGYEIHSNEHGDYTIVGLKHDLPMELADRPQELRALFAERFGPDPVASNAPGRPSPPVLLFPHHIGYRRGARGVNWDSFSSEFSPAVEIYSMHGLTDDDQPDKPSLHSMGPWQSYGTMQHGLSLGKRFGVLGNTDHHSGHPGSYGHGLTGAWAEKNDRNGIWDAIYLRRTWAMTGDAVRLWCTVNDQPMGGVVTAEPGAELRGAIDVDSTAAIDYVELVFNGRRENLWWRRDPADAADAATSSVQAIVSVELGWGERGKIADWDVEINVAGGQILECIPRFRGPEIVSPLDKRGNEDTPRPSFWRRADDNRIAFRTSTWGNLTNSTPSTQGFGIRVDDPASCRVTVIMNGREEKRSIGELLAGSVSGNLGAIDSPAYRLSAIAPDQYRWSFGWSRPAESGWCYARVRLRNGHWAIGSPVYVSC